MNIIKRLLNLRPVEPPTTEQALPCQNQVVYGKLIKAQAVQDGIVPKDENGQPYRIDRLYAKDNPNNCPVIILDARTQRNRPCACYLQANTCRTHGVIK